jgi:hypothetical protein
MTVSAFLRRVALGDTGSTLSIVGQAVGVSAGRRKNKVVKAAFTRAAERVVTTVAKAPAASQRRPAVAPAAPRDPNPALGNPPSAAQKPVRVPRAGGVPEPKVPLEHYPADALPAHIQRGVTLLRVQEGGRVWIDCLPLDAPGDAPFGYDAQGQPSAPYGRDAQGRFRNCLGAALGVASRTGRGHFVGEPDEG